MLLAAAGKQGKRQDGVKFYRTSNVEKLVAEKVADSFGLDTDGAFFGGFSGAGVSSAPGPAGAYGALDPLGGASMMLNQLELVPGSVNYTSGTSPAAMSYTPTATVSQTRTPAVYQQASIVKR